MCKIIIEDKNGLRRCRDLFTGLTLAWVPGTMDRAGLAAYAEELIKDLEVNDIKAARLREMVAALDDDEITGRDVE